MVDLKQHILDHLNGEQTSWELPRMSITDIQVVQVFGGDLPFDQWREKNHIRGKRITGGWELIRER